MKIALLTHNLGGGIEHHIFLEALLQPHNEYFKIQFQYGMVKISSFNTIHGQFEELTSIDNLHDFALFIEKCDQVEIHSVLGWEERWLWVIANLSHGNLLFIFHDYSLFTHNSHLLISRFGEWFPQASRSLSKVEESLVESSDKLLAPSNDAATRIGRFLKHELETMTVHEIEETRLEIPNERSLQNGSNPFHVVIPGHMATQKGSFMLKRCLEITETLKLPLTFTVLGKDLENHFREGQVRFIGGYSHKNLSELLIKIKPDVFWWPTNGAETYSYTLSELMNTNLTLCVPNRGSFPERVKKRQNTKIVNDPDLALCHVSTLCEAVEK